MATTIDTLRRNIPKKIFMIINYIPDDFASGISKKMRSQISVLRSLGNEVFYTAYTETGISIFDNADSLVFHSEFPIRSKKLFRFFRAFFLDDVARKYARKRNFDVGYVRWHGLGRSTIRLLKILRRQCNKVVMDTHGYFKGHNATDFIGRYLSHTTRMNQEKVGQYLDLVLSETNETEIFGVTAMRYDNGVDVKHMRPHSYTGDKNVLNLISVANEQSYHGYDRIIRSIKAHTDDSIPIFLHLVGMMSRSTVSLIHELGLENRVFCYGKQYGKALDDIYDKCNIGVGPVAQHRIGGKQGTGLKTKEMFAKGIPYLYSGQELLVPDEYPYIMRVSDDESMIDFTEVYRFYKAISEKPVATEMRAFADKYFSWEKTYKEMLNRLNDMEN